MSARRQRWREDVQIKKIKDKEGEKEKSVERKGDTVRDGEEKEIKREKH